MFLPSNKISIVDTKNELTRLALNELTEAVGWGSNYYPTEKGWHKMLACTAFVVSAFLEGRIIGFGRVVEDGQMAMFYDICVHPEYQRQRLGSQIMEKLLTKIKEKDYVSIGLFVWQGNISAEKFYSKFGFTRSLAMELAKEQRPV